MQTAVICVFCVCVSGEAARRDEHDRCNGADEPCRVSEFEQGSGEMETVMLMWYVDASCASVEPIEMENRWKCY